MFIKDLFFFKELSDNLSYHCNVLHQILNFSVLETLELDTHYNTLL